MTSLPERDREPVVTSDPRALAGYCLELLAIGAAYFVLARAGLLLASIHASATPVWPAAGLALAAILLRRRQRATHHDLVRWRPNVRAPERRREIRSALSCTGYGDQRDPRCRQPGARWIRRVRAIPCHRVHLVARERGRRTGRYAGDRPVDHGPISAIRFRPVYRIDDSPACRDRGRPHRLQPADRADGYP